MTSQTVVDKAWSDAYYIAWVGASNPKGVQRTLTEHTASLGETHPAVRAIAGHLAFLAGTSLGPDSDVLEQVLANARRLGLHQSS